MMENLLRFDSEKIYTFIDFETENLCLNFANNRPWQCGMIKVKGQEVIDSADIYIKWDKPINVSKEAAVMTRFDPYKYAKIAIHSSEAFKIIKEWLENCDYIGGHNVLNFDIYLIKEFYQLYNTKWQHLVEKVIDTNCLAKGLKYNIPYSKDLKLIEYQYKIVNERRKGIKTNLTSLGKEYNIDHDYSTLHDALNDLHLNIKIWNKLKFQIAI
jgi:DNA polymerase III epsilon subunit-like protein